MTQQKITENEEEKHVWMNKSKSGRGTTIYLPDGKHVLVGSMNDLLGFIFGTFNGYRMTMYSLEEMEEKEG